MTLSRSIGWRGRAVAIGVGQGSSRNVPETAERRGLSVRLFGVVATLVLLVAWGAAPAAAVQYPPSGNGLTVNKTNLAPGEALTLTGSGYTAGATITITIESTPLVLGTTVADGTGAFTTTVSIPTTFAAGRHTVKATGEGAGGSTIVLSAAVTVASSGSGHPFTGANVGPPVLVGVGLILVGMVLIVTVRRRRSAMAV